MNWEGCGSVAAYFVVISQHFSGDTEVNCEGPVGLADLWARNRI